MDYQIDPRTILSASTTPIQDQKAKDLKSLKASCQEFEAMLLMEMVKTMRESVPEGGLFEKSNATEIYTEMLDMETVRQSVASHPVGIADAMYKQMAELINNRKE